MHHRALYSTDAHVRLRKWIRNTRQRTVMLLKHRNLTKLSMKHNKKKKIFSFRFLDTLFELNCFFSWSSTCNQFAFFRLFYEQTITKSKHFINSCFVCKICCRCVLTKTNGRMMMMYPYLLLMNFYFKHQRYYERYVCTEWVEIYIKTHMDTWLVSIVSATCSIFFCHVMCRYPLNDFKS